MSINDRTETLDGLMGVRENLGMYIGGTYLEDDGLAPPGLTQLAQEVISNSIDEFLTNYGDKIKIEIFEDNSMQITDHGRGLPKGENKNDFDEVIRLLTIPHSSGKFRGQYTTGAAGMHGIGIKAVNAASEYVRVNVGGFNRDGSYSYYEIEFNQDKVINKEVIKYWSKSEVEEQDDNTVIEKKSGNTLKRGTVFTFLPDAGLISDKNQQPVFQSIEWTLKSLIPRLEASSFLNAGLEIELIDNRDKKEDENGELQSKRYVWKFEKGLEDYVDKITAGQELLDGVDKTIHIQGKDNLGNLGVKGGPDKFIEVNGVLRFISDIDTTILSYANGVPTRSGGTHQDGFINGLTRAIVDYAEDNELLKKSDGKLTSKDVEEGLVAVFEVRVPSDIAQFAGQTKDRLSTSHARGSTQRIVQTVFTDWLYDHDKQAKTIVKAIVESKKNREKAIRDRRASKRAEKTSKGGKMVLASKLKTASSRNPKEKELFITEGDSASNIKRDTRTQAIFPIRGKIRNVYDLSLSRALENDEVSTITSVLGAGIGPSFDLEDMEYDKVIMACFSGDTKVKSLDGNSYSFRELVENNVEDLWIYALDKNGNMVPALATDIRKTGESKEMVKITLDNGETIESTLDHNFMMLSGEYQEARDIKIGDSLMPLHTRIDYRGYEEFYDDNESRWVKTHRRVNESMNNAGYENAYDRVVAENETVERVGSMVHTHHKDRDKLNNVPDNLVWLTRDEHFSLHRDNFSEWNKSKEKIERTKRHHLEGRYDHTYFGQNGYNGSEEHITAVKDAHSRGVYNHTYFGQNGYNGSEKNRKVAKEVNASKKHIESVEKNKILMSIKYLIVNNLPFDEYHYDYYRHFLACRYHKILNWFDSYENAYRIAKDYKYRNFKHAKDYVYEYDNNKRQRTQIAKSIKRILDDDLVFNEENYNKLKGSRTPRYENITRWFNSVDEAIEHAKHVNHKIVDIEFVNYEHNQDVYCLRVDEYHNFLLDSGVFVKNCDADQDASHIILLLTGLFYKFFKPLVEAGKLYYVEPPLYKATKYINGKPDIKMFYSQGELDNYKGSLKGYDIQRYKGLGEMDTDEAYDSITRKDTRRLVQVNVDDAVEINQLLKTLIGGTKTQAERKQWILDNVDFSKEVDD